MVFVCFLPGAWEDVFISILGKTMKNEVVFS